ncbi:hypothetical protein C6J46_003749 [Salmonella enterica subsp. enterica serovar Javiana]|nr:hypothetical protein [Salmonella enterica]EDS5051543.1 hypothetical protein [Salmonella enterica subsp. enterica serovar Javiana]ECP1439020.1 hypothetical protein [Salmonella enterica]EDU2246200.1 hypothetical protein [Salmonella enterica subsp. enterica serovar Javiana]EDX4344593.1 hypothetical protein [Salmonella enterica subsp. enterica serovar Javiana]
MAWSITFRGVTVVAKNRYHGLVGPRQLILAGSLLRHDKASDGHHGVHQTCRLSLKKRKPRQY